MGVKLHNNQSPMGIRFCCISLEIISRARWKRQDSATVHKARAGSDYTASQAHPQLPCVLFHLPNNKCKKLPLTCSTWNLKQHDRQQWNLKCQYKTTLKSCFETAMLLQWHTVKAELKAEWFLIEVTASSWQGASRGVLIFSFWWPARGHMEMEWSYIRGSSDWTIGEDPSPRRCLVTGSQKEWL